MQVICENCPPLKQYVGGHDVVSGLVVVVVDVVDPVVSRQMLHKTLF